MAQRLGIARAIKRKTCTKESTMSVQKLQMKSIFNIKSTRYLLVTVALLSSTIESTGLYAAKNSLMGEFRQEMTQTCRRISDRGINLGRELNDEFVQVRRGLGVHPNLFTEIKRALKD